MINPLKSYTKTQILNKECQNIIQSLNKIDASGTGIFMDYLIRRLIRELRYEKFDDNRAGKIITNSGFLKKI